MLPFLAQACQVSYYVPYKFNYFTYLVLKWHTLHSEFYKTTRCRSCCWSGQEWRQERHSYGSRQDPGNCLFSMAKYLIKLPVFWTVGAILLWLLLKGMEGKAPVYRDLLQSTLSLNKVLQGGGKPECDPSENKGRKKIMLLKTKKGILCL